MKKQVKSVFSIVLVVLMLATTFLGVNMVGIMPAVAASKKVPQRTIAIVYDNSGSMFDGDGNTRWCQAQYAIEIFASMMNQNDKMLIYPMRPVYINAVGNGEQYNYWSNPYVITTDAQKTSVRNFITDHKNFSDNTPIESVDAAYQGLAKEQGEKWLIVMTDGKTFNEGKDEKDVPEAETKKRLGEAFTKYLGDTNVIYLGIGDGIKAPTAEATSESFEYISKITSAEDIPSNLTVLCNKIFGRDQLPKANDANAVGYKDKEVNFDLSLSKLYLFVQGKNISDIKLTSSKTGNVITATKSFSPRYGTFGHATTYNKKFQYDETRQGCIAVYENLEPGKYTYTYNGTMSSVAFYYEPDVDLMVTLTDPSGAKVTDFSKVQPGKYLLNYMLVDARDNSKPLESILLGDVYYSVDYNLAGKQQTATSEKQHDACEIQMEANQSLTLIAVDASYLNGYKISKTGPELGFPSSGILADKADSKDFQIIVSGGKETYEPDHINDEGVYTVTFKYDGAQITGEKVDNVTIDAESLNTAIGASLERNGDSYTLKLQAPEDLMTVDAGEYAVLLKGTYDPKVEKPGNAGAQVNYKVSEITQKLKIELLDVSKNYVISSLKKNKDNTLKAKITIDGEPLTEEQLSALVLDTYGLPMKATRLEGQSAYQLTFDKDAEYKKGKFTITAKASNVNDRKGRSLEASDSVDVKLQQLPSWVTFLIVLLIILFLLGVILFVLTRKILPYKVIMAKSEVEVGGKTQTYNCICSVGGKNNFFRRTVTAKSDLIPNSVYNQFSMTIDIIHGNDKNSWFVRPSKKRHYIIAGFSCPTQGAKTVSFASKEFLLKNGKPVDEDGAPFQPIVVKKAKFPITVNGSVDKKDYDVDIYLEIKK